MNEEIKRIFIDTVTTYNYSDKEVDDNVLHELYELTKWSATSFNCSPLRLIFLKSKEAKDRVCLLYTSPSPRDVEESRIAWYA